MRRTIPGAGQVGTILRSVARSRRAAVDFVGDVVDFVLKRADDLTPPRRLRRLIGHETHPRDHRATGTEFAGYFRTLCDLKPNETVLDVGCGSGRMAVPLTTYLTTSGGYDGFDIAKSAVDWCQRHISARHPHFHFQHADVHNARYNPGGRQRAADFGFPYAGESFDLVFAGSVFTHMLPADMEHYLAEMARVMRRGGRSLITFLLLNEESLRLMAAGRATLDFKHAFGVYRTAHAVVLEAAVSYDEAFVRRQYQRCGLKVSEPIQWGSWCGRERFLSYQDIVVAIKE